MKAEEIVEAKEIRILIWIYFVLLIFEGALRKWILPGLAEPLLLVRDPFLMMIYVAAFARGVFVINGTVMVLGVLGFISLLLGFTVGSGNVIVTVFGFDAMFFHLPLIYLLPRVMNRDHVVGIGKAMLWFCLPMAAIMVLQFRAGPEDWVNVGAGGSVGAQIRGALGKIRPPGFFSFITGAAQFLGLATAFLLFGWIRKGTYSRYLLLLAGGAIALSAGISTSRLTLGSIGLVFVMLGLIVLLDRKSVGGIMQMLVPIGIILLVVTNLDVFKEGGQVFEARFEEAGDADVNIIGKASNWTERVFGDFLGGFKAIEHAPILGAGLGVGTNVGARVLSGEYGFLLAEGEWARCVLELGPMFGLIYLFTRLAITISVFLAAVHSAREGNALPLLLFGACGQLMLAGQFGQPTTLGFAVLGSGLCLACRNVPPAVEVDVRAEEEEAVQASARKIRGRSTFAESLHDGSPGESV